MLSQFLLFGPRAFHILDPQNLEVVLSARFDDYGFGVRHGVFAPLLGHGIFTQEGPAWKRSRELLRKQFVRTQYQNLDHFREHVDNLLACLPTSGGVVDLQPLFFKLTLDTTTALLLGRSVQSLKADNDADETNKVFARNWDIAQGGLAKRFRLAPWHFFYNTIEFRRACNSVHRFVDNYIEQRQEEKRIDGAVTDSDSFVDQLAQESESLTSLRHQLLNILLAGRDTTARLLVRHEKVMQRLQNEVKSVMGSAVHPSREQIRKMPFLTIVLKESLRLFPPVPLNNRTATRTTILPRGGGPDGSAPVLVRRGELVVFSQYVNSRRKNIYGLDANDFRPERWEKDGASTEYGWAFFPFNGGPRACLGQDFAMMEVSYTVVRLLQAIPRMDLPKGEPDNGLVGTERQRLTLVLSSADGCRIELVAVHGLNGDALKTWTSDKGNICWLSDDTLLPRYLEAATNRPIIFLCHSLGGIVVKRALAYSKSRTAAKIAHLHNIFTCTYGILFFGTPHHGSCKADMLSTLQKVVSLAVPRKVLQTDSNLVRALKEDSEILQEITDHFVPLMKDLRIFFFWEQERTDLKYTKDYVVNEASAAPSLDDTERAGIAADHRNICKFESKDSPGFRTVIAALRRYSEKAPGAVETRLARVDKAMREQRLCEAQEILH
ncbi:MAG: hypothetical protein Q9209_004530 [Squamulea sp. 1 TL-2023]